MCKSFFTAPHEGTEHHARDSGGAGQLATGNSQRTHHAPPTERQHHGHCHDVPQSPEVPMTNQNRLVSFSARARVHRYSVREVLLLTVLGIAAVTISLTIAFLDPSAALAVPDRMLDTAR